MTALIKFILTLLIGTYAATAVAQSFNATVHDARTNEPIPFATVSCLETLVPLQMRKASLL